LYELTKLISEFYSEKYDVCVYDKVVEEFKVFWYLEITDWESVYMFIVLFLRAVMKANRMVVSSVLNEQGQSFIWAWNVCRIELLEIWTYPIPIEHCEVPKSITEPSV